MVRTRWGGDREIVAHFTLQIAKMAQCFSFVPDTFVSSEARSEGQKAPKTPLGFDRPHLDPGRTRAFDAKLDGGRIGEIDDAIVVKGAAIVDPHHDTAAVLEIGTRA